jgi:hypothetical protein
MTNILCLWFNQSQGYQIGRIFAFYVIVYFGEFNENLKKLPKSLD